MVPPCSGQEQRAGVAQSHQESTRGRDKNHAPGSDTAGTHAECHRSIPGAETLECVRLKNERKDTRVLQPDVIIGWPDWNKVQPFAMSGWAVPGQTLPGATAPATRWHLRMNRRGGPPIYLNVELDPMRKRSTITHEAAVRTGAAYEPFYMIFARAEDGEVRSLTAVGADAIVRADRRRPADPAEKGPDLLMDA